MISSIKECAKLNNGLKMPWLGFGVYKINDGLEVEQAVRSALEIGYRSIDTASIYGTERGVGKAIRESSIPREDIFLITKVWNDAEVLFRHNGRASGSGSHVRRPGPLRSVHGLRENAVATGEPEPRCQSIRQVVSAE